MFFVRHVTFIPLCTHLIFTKGLYPKLGSYQRDEPITTGIWSHIIPYGPGLSCAFKEAERHLLPPTTRYKYYSNYYMQVASTIP